LNIVASTTAFVSLVSIVVIGSVVLDGDFTGVWSLMLSQ
jgi:hypothetical protein